MSRIGTIFPRSTLLGSSDQLTASLQRSQSALSSAQQSISSGRSINRPSDESARTSVILLLENQLQSRAQHDRNLQHGISVLNFVDQSFNDATDNLIEARDIASSQIGVGSDSNTRASEAAVIDAMIQGLMNVSNREYQGISLFGGNGGAGPNDLIFDSFLGGVRYRGATSNLSSDMGLSAPQAFTSNGDEAFGALSSRAEGSVDLDPQSTAPTRIVDVRGALGLGVRPGSVVVTIDGTPTTVDLASADNLGDVVTRVNDAIDGVDPTAGSLSVGGAGYSLTANAGHTIGIANLGAGTTAADLGIELSATSATVAGADLDPLLTELTELSALGAAVDFASGLKITQGGQTKIADFSGATTVQDMMNQVDQLNLGLRLQINDSGTGLDLFSEVSGVQLSVGENSGGTTAQDLGLRTFDLGTELTNFRLGQGVEVQQGVDDFALELHDGRSFAVNLDGLSTVGQVITAIQAAAASAAPPLVVGDPGDGGTDLNLGLAPDGNGFQFEDNTAGPNDFRVVNLGVSLAATHLGFYENVRTGGTIVGADVAQVRAESIFTHLIDLHVALVNDDSSGIIIAGDAIEADIESLARVRADVGVRSRQVEQQQRRSGDLKNTELTMLSGIRDTDFTTAITEFLQLQQQLEASLRVGAQNLQLSFLDFLR